MSDIGMRVNRIQTFGRRRCRKIVDSDKSVLHEISESYAVRSWDDCIARSYDSWCLEIGFGSGESLIANAHSAPNVGFIGVEPFENGVVSLAKKIKSLNLTNVHFFMGDVRDFLPSCHDAVFQKAYMFFPDPWPKKKHHKRRLFNQEFWMDLRRVVSDSFYFASDDSEYCYDVLHILYDDPRMRDLSVSNKEPEWFSDSRYHRKACEAGSVCTYIAWRG